MHPEITALAARHALSDAALRELEELWSRRDTGSRTLFDGYTSVELAPDPFGAAPEHGDAPERVADRYEDLGPLGLGGMGEVRRVRDVELNRTLAMKIVHPHLLHRVATLARFLEEAQATAQLQHPNIVPVHDIGRMPDGRVWFTMREVRGRTLGDVIAEVHAASRDAWLPSATGWTFRRLVAAFHAVCNAVAYAHERGVVHRDLKPDNVMVGSHGEVYVLDWGLAKILGRSDHLPDTDDLEVVRTERSEAGGAQSLAGQIAGTPAYMPPEQARGDTDQIDARSDVYALGAILYEILSGAPPFQGPAARVLAEVLTSAPPPLERAAPATLVAGLELDGHAVLAPRLPSELVDACERAMARDPALRFPSAEALAEEVRAWMDGARRRDQALEVTQRALAAVAEADDLARQAIALRAEAKELLAGVKGWEPEARKAPGWAKVAQADDAERAAALRRLAVDQGLHGALQVAPDLAEAHAALAQRYQARHAEAERSRRLDEQLTAEALLTDHATALPEGHPVRRGAAAYLKGDGALTLLTDPPGAEVLLFRYVERTRRLEEVFERSLGVTPLRAVPLPMGSYLCVLRHPDRAEVRYPVQVTRLGEWDGVAPGEATPRPVWLPPRGFLAPDEVYVPPGPFRAGGDPEVNSFRSMRPWCHGFVMHRFPITNVRYLAFLDDLVASGREAEALQHAPRERSGTDGEQGALIYGYADGRFSLRPDEEGDAWLPDWPVVQIDWHGARAWLAWWAARTGRPWRLPAELEWEKAARGVDGRWYPWGDHHDPSWCCMVDSHPGRPLPAVVDSFPVDAGPCGVRGLGGNVHDWCLDVWAGFDPTTAVERVVVPDADREVDPSAQRVIRGGNWHNNSRTARSAGRFRHQPGNRAPIIGFRGVFEL